MPTASNHNQAHGYGIKKSQYIPTTYTALAALKSGLKAKK
jgi:hypothetical protein